MALPALAALDGALVLFPPPTMGHEDPAAGGPAPANGLKLETLLSAVLEGVDGTEVIVSRVTIRPNTSSAQALASGRGVRVHPRGYDHALAEGQRGDRR